VGRQFFCFCFLLKFAGGCSILVLTGSSAQQTNEWDWILARQLCHASHDAASTTLCVNCHILRDLHSIVSFMHRKIHYLLYLYDITEYQKLPKTLIVFG